MGSLRWRAVRGIAVVTAFTLPLGLTAPAQTE
jgi:hypothetical protein